MIDVTAENISEYSINDVVMPMPGHCVRMPENSDLKAMYEELLRKDGITMDNFAKMAS